MGRAANEWVSENLIGSESVNEVLQVLQTCSLFEDGKLNVHFTLPVYSSPRHLAGSRI